MKKTYIKITTLICILIVAVMVLGAALFTYIQISKINSDFLSSIQHTSSIKPTESFDYKTYVLEYQSQKLISSMQNPNIGYYSKTDWKWNNAENSETLESTAFRHIIGYLENSDGWKIKMIYAPDDEKGGVNFTVTGKGGVKTMDGLYVLEGNSEMTVYFYSTVDSNILTKDVTIEYPDMDQQVPLTVSALDKEAEKKYQELKNSGINRIDLTELGWLTSYVAYSSDTPLLKNMVSFNEWNVYVYHPLAIVWNNYMYVYCLFLAVMVVLLFLTIFLMRRMYVNRMSYEARTQSLTRSFAHELKTPLAVTKTYVENWDIVDEKERPEVAAKINTEVDHMTKMVNTLLDLSKMESGDMKLKLEEVELFELTKACYKHVENLAKERSLSVEFKKDKEDGEYIVSADLDLMRMVISNFLSNAIKYGKEKVLVALSSSGNNITFRITNDGEPISRKDQKKIWDLFYTKDKSGTDRLNSNGVGLAVNKSILELHKAKFGVESSPAGNSFWFEMKKAKE